MNGQQKNNCHSDLNAYGFPASMRIYSLPNLLVTQRVKWTMTVTVPITFLIQVSGYNSLGKQVKVMRNVEKLEVELVLPICYKPDLDSSFCYGVLICSQPQTCWDLIEMSFFLIPMAQGQPRVLAGLRKMFVEHANKLMTARSLTPARRGTSGRGRGRGAGRRGQSGKTMTEAGAQKVWLGPPETPGSSQTVETIDLVDESSSVVKRSDVGRSTPSVNNNVTVRYAPKDVHGAFKGSTIPNNNEINPLASAQTDALTEISGFSNVSLSNSHSSFGSLNHHEVNTPLTIRNQFGQCQVYLSHKNQALDSTNTDKSVVTNSAGVQNTWSTHKFSTNSQHLTQTAPAAPGVNNLLKNFTSPQSSTHGFPANSQSLSYPSPYASRMHAENFYQRHPTTANNSLIGSSGHRSIPPNYQNPVYRPWSSCSMSDQTTSMHGGLPSATGADSYSSPQQNINSVNYTDYPYSSIRPEKLPTFDEAISTLRARNDEPTPWVGYHPHFMAAGSGYPANNQYVPNVEINQQSVFSGNLLPNGGKRDVNGFTKPASFQSFQSTTNGDYRNYNPNYQRTYGRIPFQNQSVQNNHDHQYCANTQNQQNLSTMLPQNNQSNHLPMAYNSFQTENVVKPFGNCNKDDNYVNMLSNSTDSTKSSQTLTQIKTNEISMMNTSVGGSTYLNKPDIDYSNASEYGDDSDEPGLVIDEGARGVDTFTVHHRLLQEGLDALEIKPLDKLDAGDAALGGQNLYSSLADSTSDGNN